MGEEATVLTDNLVSPHLSPMFQCLLTLPILPPRSSLLLELARLFRVQNLPQPNVGTLPATNMNVTEVWQELKSKKYHINFYKGFLCDFCEDNLIFPRAHGHTVISSADWHYLLLLFSGKGESFLRKCYRNTALGHLKY